MSLIDEFQAGLKISDATGPKSILGTNMFRNLKLQEDAPMFSKTRINFIPNSPLTHMVIKNNHLVLSMANMTLMKIDLLQPEDIVEIDLRKFSSGGKVFKIFMDPTGQHILISIAQNESVPIGVLYLPWKSVKPRDCTKLKDILLTAVGWSPYQVSDQCTGPLLLGTADGTLYEYELLSDLKLIQSGFEKTLKPVFEITKASNNYITELQVVQPHSDRSAYCIFCATQTDLYTFSGFIASFEERPFFVNIFHNYTNDSSSLLNSSSFPAWKPLLQVASSTPTNDYHRFAWLTDDKVHSGSLDWKNVRDTAKVCSRPYQDMVEESTPPCDFVMTKFHIVIAWPTKIVAYCSLNGQLVLEDRVPEACGRICGITEDQQTNTIWAFAQNAVFKYKVEREDRNIWQVYLSQKLYDKARSSCSKEESLLSYIQFREAEDLYEDKQFEESAQIFATVKASFEEICLKFMHEEKALKIFLHHKLEYLTATDQTQITLVVMWMLELYLKQLGSLRDSNQRNTEQYNAVDLEFKTFLSNPKVRKCVNENSNAVYNLLSSHDDQDNYVAIAVIMKDFNRVILHLISHQRHVEALEVMRTQGSVKLFYQHTSALLQTIPEETIDALVSLGQQLDPKILLPSLILAHASFGHSQHVLRYVEFSIDKLDVSDKVMHNFLITLYCLHAPDKLLDYLKLQGDDGNCVAYDVKIALRECMTGGHEEACIHIMTTMNLYKDAVELALKTDVSLAKAVANRTKYDESACKQLWLIIAAHVVENEKDVGKAMEVLQECPLLKIEDILPFFPDFVTIDQFKDTICASLETYNEQINALKHDMEDASKIATDIHGNIKKFKQKQCIVKASDVCSECQYPLLTRAFYLFNCAHKFHQDCLSDAVMNYLPEAQQKMLSELRGKLIASANSDRLASLQQRDDIRQKIDSILAAECLYCGDIAINNVDTPFIPDTEWEDVLAAWQ